MIQNVLLVDIGFDHPNLIFQVNVGWPHDWMQFRQQIGRLSCQGQDSVSHLLVGFNGYVYAAISAQLRRFDPNMASVHDLQTNELLNHNTSVFSPSSRRQQRSQSTTNAQRRRVADVFHHQLLNMLGLIVLNWGCVHCRLEHLSGTGKMHSGPFDFDNDAFDSCGTDCFICTGEWKKQFRAVHLDTAVRWLDSGAIRDTFPIVGKTDDIGGLRRSLI